MTISAGTAGRCLMRLRVLSGVRRVCVVSAMGLESSRLLGPRGSPFFGAGGMSMLGLSRFIAIHHRTYRMPAIRMAV